MLINLEGIDGCGKSTQSQFLMEKFESDDELIHLRSWLNYFINDKKFEILMRKYPRWEESQPELLYP